VVSHNTSLEWKKEFAWAFHMPPRVKNCTYLAGERAPFER